MKTGTLGRTQGEWNAYFLARLILGRSITFDGDTANASSTTALAADYLQIQLNQSGISSNSTAALVKIDASLLRATLGPAPILLDARLNLWQRGGTSGLPAYPIDLYRLIASGIDWSDPSYRYKDLSGVATWYADQYNPYPGRDCSTLPVISFTSLANATGAEFSDYTHRLDLTAELRAALISGGLLTLFMRINKSQSAAGTLLSQFYWNQWASKPNTCSYVSFAYIFPIEFYPALPDGTIDLLTSLDGSPDFTTGYLDLGAYEHSAIGTPVKCWAKNYAGRTISVIEVWDDAPEWEPPQRTAGTGTGTLNYLSLASAAVSQHYYLQFTSPTDYQVKALAYRDYTSDLHPSYGGAGWVGTTGGDLALPLGGVLIPASAFTGVFVAGDVLEVLVTGNTTDPSWPTDSGPQVEMTLDSSGSPDTANWRPVTAARTRTAAGITIDATSKTVTTLHLDTSQWPTGTRCFISDGTNIDHGTIASAAATSVGVTFDSASGHVYASGVRFGTTLPLLAVTSTTYHRASADFGVSQPQPNRIPLDAVSGLSVGHTLLLQDVVNGSITELAVISYIGSNYVLAVANLVNDYASGAFIAVRDMGQAPFWLRVHENATTTYEMKKLRLSVRT